MAKRQTVNRYGMAVAVILLSAVALALLSRNISRPFMLPNHESYNGAYYSLIAHNYVNQGLIRTKLGQVSIPLPGPSSPSSLYRFYVDHPPLLPLLVALFFRLLGEHEWTARLIPILFSVASVPLVYLLGRRWWGSHAGFFAAVFFIINPMFLVFGRMVDHEPLVLFFLLLAILSYDLWTQGNRQYLGVLCAALFLGGITGWPMYYLVPILTIHYLIFVRDYRLSALIPLAMPAVTLCLLYLQLSVVGPTAVQSLIGAFFFRTNMNSALGNRSSISLQTFAFQYIFPRAREFFGSQLMLLASLGTIAAVKRDEKKASAALLLGLFAVALIHVLLFKNGALVHEYWLYYFVAPLALGAGAMLSFFGSLTSLRIAYAAMLVLATIIVCLGAPVIASFNQGNLGNLAAIGEAVSSLSRPGDYFLTSQPAGGPAMAYYYGRYGVQGINTVAQFKEAMKLYPATLMVIDKTSCDLSLKQYLDRRYKHTVSGNIVVYTVKNR